MLTVSKMIYFHITLVYALIKTRNGVTANASTESKVQTLFPATFYDLPKSVKTDNKQNFCSVVKKSFWSISFEIVLFLK